jgi:plastocyanin
MRTKKLIILATVLMLAIFLVNPLLSVEGEEEGVALVTKVVVIKGQSELKPPDIISQRGTTVVWVNHSSTPQEILFLDKKVVLACGSPVNFIVGHDGTYESSKIPFGGTASLCFTEKGKYAYTVTSSKTFSHRATDKAQKGTVTIK